VAKRPRGIRANNSFLIWGRSYFQGVKTSISGVITNRKH
jgi:hypothetical protein